MKKLPRIVDAEVVIHGVLKVTFDDGHQGVVDPCHHDSEGQDIRVAGRARTFRSGAGRRIRPFRLVARWLKPIPSISWPTRCAATRSVRRRYTA